MKDSQNFNLLQITCCASRVQSGWPPLLTGADVLTATEVPTRVCAWLRAELAFQALNVLLCGPRPDVRVAQAEGLERPRLPTRGAVSFGEASLSTEIHPLPLHLEVSTCPARVWQDSAKGVASLDRIPMIG